MDYLRLVFGSLGVALFAVHMFVGVGPASDALYGIGLWPARTLPEIQEAVLHSFPENAVACRSGENGWDYMCDLVRSQAPLPPLRRKFGIACGASQPVLSMMEMRADEPTRPRPDGPRISFHVSPVLVLLLFGALSRLACGASSEVGKSPRGGWRAYSLVRVRTNLSWINRCTACSQ